MKITLFDEKYFEGNERDRSPLLPLFKIYFLSLEGKLGGPLDIFKLEEECGNNRSVMPLDVPGCTRATMIIAVSI